MKFATFILILYSAFFFPQSGFQIPASEKKVVMPFQLINNLVFIQLKVNGVDLTFLLDTGVSETILFSVAEKEVSFPSVERRDFTGLGENVSIEGLKADHNSLEADKDFIDLDHTIYVILDEEFNFSSHIGIPVHGIIGYYFFKDYPVEIDHVSKKITIYNNRAYFQKKVKKFTSVPIILEYNKPYLIADVQMKKERKASKLLVDTGNSDAVWLFPVLIKDFVYNRPNIDDFLGRGFNGDIYGKRSRINTLFIGDYALSRPITSMPDEYSIQHLKLAEDRKGSVGNEVMRRFTTIYDYKANTLYLKKNKYLKDPFLFNMSGLEFKHIGTQWEQEKVKASEPKNEGSNNSNTININNFIYTMVLKPVFAISGVRKNSPAFRAGLKKDDVLMSINRESTSNMTLQKLTDLMNHDEGKYFIFEVKRNGETLKFQFYLEDPIPYQEEL